MESTNPYGTPQQSPASSGPAAGLRRVQIKRIDPFSTAFMIGTLYVLIGLIFGGLLSLAAVMGIAVGGNGAMEGMLGVLGALTVLPMFYGFMGFLVGLIGAGLYNFVAGFVGGIRMDLDG